MSAIHLTLLTILQKRYESDVNFDHKPGLIDHNTHNTGARTPTRSISVFTPVSFRYRRANYTVSMSRQKSYRVVINFLRFIDMINSVSFLRPLCTWRVPLSCLISSLALRKSLI